MPNKCERCPILKVEVLDTEANFDAMSRSLSEAAMDDETVISGEINIVREDGSTFSRSGEIDGPAAAEILDELDEQKTRAKKDIYTHLACDGGPLTLRAAGVEVVLCRRLTDRVPDYQRIAVDPDPDKLIPVFIQPAQSPPPENA